MIHDRYLQRAAAIVAEFAQTGRDTTLNIAEEPDPAQAITNLFDRSDAVMVVYPDPAEYGGFNIVVAKEPVPKDDTVLSCLYCENQFHAVALLCAYGDLAAETREGSARLLRAGASDTYVHEAFQGAVMAACKDKQSYVQTLAARFRLSDRATASSTHH